MNAFVREAGNLAQDYRRPSDNQKRGKLSISSIVGSMFITNVVSTAATTARPICKQDASPRFADQHPLPDQRAPLATVRRRAVKEDDSLAPSSVYLI